jgi:arginase family enzyme
MLRASDLKTKIQSTGYAVEDHGNVSVSQDLLRHLRLGGGTGGQSQQSGETFFAENIRPHVSAVLTDLAAETHAAVKANGLPLVLGGDNCTTVGGIVGAQQARAEQSKLPLGLLIFNAHAGCNTWETTKSQQLRGMSLSALLGASVSGFEDLTRTVTHDQQTGDRGEHRRMAQVCGHP